MSIKIYAILVILYVNVDIFNTAYKISYMIDKISYILYKISYLNNISDIIYIIFFILVI